MYVHFGCVLNEFPTFVGCNKGCVALSPSLEATIVELQQQQQHHQQQQQTRPPSRRVVFRYRPSWNLGLGSCFGAIHRLNWSDLWMIKFVHCQSPFLPGTNTSDIGAKAKEKPRVACCCWVTWPPWRLGAVLRSRAPPETRENKDLSAQSSGGVCCK